MSPELEKNLKDRYSDLFSENFTHFYCDDGWYRLIENTLNLIQYRKNYTNIDISINQIKEKFGGLRIYCNNSDDFIFGITYMAELMSLYTCEITGKPGFLCRNKNGVLIKTMCVEEAEKQGFYVLNPDSSGFYVLNP